MRWVWLILGVLAVLVGVVWTLQGLNVLKGSGMSGQPMWAIIGPILAIIGLALVGFGAGIGRRRASSVCARDARDIAVVCSHGMYRIC